MRLHIVPAMPCLVLTEKASVRCNPLSFCAFPAESDLLEQPCCLQLLQIDQFVLAPSQMPLLAFLCRPDAAVQGQREPQAAARPPSVRGPAGGKTGEAGAGLPCRHQRWAQRMCVPYHVCVCVWLMDCMSASKIICSRATAWSSTTGPTHVRLAMF